MSILQSAQRRYAAKAFDASKKLSSEEINTLKEVLRLSPSAINYQPWHFLLIRSEQAREKLIKALQGEGYKHNIQRVRDAAMIVVLCSQREASAEQIAKVMEQEYQDGRFKNQTLKQNRQAMMSNYIDNLNQHDPLVVQFWLEKQTYLALGNVLLAAADMGIDSVAIEGFDKAIVNETFELSDKGYHASVLALFGHHSDDDFNAQLPKSRFASETIFTEYE